jgi:predicted PurR-regulated permease PerM
MGFLDGPEKALWVALTYLAIQQLEGNVVTPLLMKEGLDLPPALTIIGQSVMALAFGFVGLVIAMPLLGAVMVPIKLLYVQDVVGAPAPPTRSFAPLRMTTRLPTSPASRASPRCRP